MVLKKVMHFYIIVATLLMVCYLKVFEQFKWRLVITPEINDLIV